VLGLSVLLDSCHCFLSDEIANTGHLQLCRPALASILLYLAASGHIPRASGHFTDGGAAQAGYVEVQADPPPSPPLADPQWYTGKSS
jgi:hypothetical protein